MQTAASRLRPSWTSTSSPSPGSLSCLVLILCLAVEGAVSLDGNPWSSKGPTPRVQQQVTPRGRASVEAGQARVRELRDNASPAVLGGITALLGLVLLALLRVGGGQKMNQDDSSKAVSSNNEFAKTERRSRNWSFWDVDAEQEAEKTDPGLMRKYTTFKTYKTSKTTYPAIRTFYRPHSQADKLPSEPSPLPLLVFVHGLGGSAAQFSPILTSLINIAPCLAIDLPGCGRSKFAPKSWKFYTQDALAELLAVAVKEHLQYGEGQGVVFIGHSMGCSLSALVAATHFAPGNVDGVEVLGLTGICPQSEPFKGSKLALFTFLLFIPTCLFDLNRAMDRRKGINSGSITQFTSKEADEELRHIQLKFNRQSRTPVFRRMAWGLLPRRLGKINLNEGMRGLDTWASLKVPLFLVAGESDRVTTPEQVTKIGQALGKIPTSKASSKVSRDDDNAGEWDDRAVEEDDGLSQTETTVLDQREESLVESQNPFSKKRQVLKTCILPAPASHALLYAPSTSHILAGLCQTFFSEHVDTRLSLGWQLQHLSTEGKWDVKNLAKWEAIEPVSKPIAGIFRALKTLREIDGTHSPEKFAERWKSRIHAVIDISHESPVYDPKGLEERGIEYHKFPTVSKIPPTPDEVQDFIKLVDRLRGSSVQSGTPKPSTPTPSPADLSSTPSSSPEEPLIGVHCHYGFNRTGFFICSYLIEREGYNVQAAIDAFAAARPKGIKHAHFLDQLFVRYCVGLKRAPTM